MEYQLALKSLFTTRKGPPDIDTKTLDELIPKFLP